MLLNLRRNICQMKSFASAIMMVLLWGLPVVCSAERAYLDSLRQQIGQTANDSLEVDLLWEISYEYYAFSPDSGLMYSEQMLALASRIGYKVGQAAAYLNFGVNHWAKGQYDQALTHYNQALDLSKSIGYQFGIASACNNIAGIYDMRGELAKALANYQAIISIPDTALSPYLKATAYNNAGLIYEQQDEYKKALAFFQKALALSDSTDDMIGLAIAYANIGLVYRAQGDYALALLQYKKALAISQRYEDFFTLVNSHYALGVIFTKQRQYDSALIHQQQALALARELGDKPNEGYVLDGLAEIAFLQKRYSDAKRYATQALEIGEQIGDLGIISNAASSLQHTAYQTGRYRQAYQALLRYSQARDSVFNEKQMAKLTRIQAEYEFQQEKDSIKAANAIRQLEMEKDIASREARQLATYLGLGLSSALLITILYFYRTKQKDNRLLQEQSKELIASNEELSISQEELQAVNEALSSTLDTVEKQRADIMASIHYAQRIQQAILPSKQMLVEQFPGCFVLYRPKDVVSGDFYWFTQHSGKLLIAAADCTGHGVPGAMVSVICNNGLNRSVREHGHTDPGEILNMTRELVIAEFEKSEREVQDGMDIALCTFDGMTLQYAGANNPLWIIRQGQLIETKADRQPIGQYRKAHPFTTHTTRLQRGDTIYLFSDGYQDQFGGKEDRKFGKKRLKELLLSIQALDMPTQQQRLEAAFDAWKGDQMQIDDVCVIGVRV